MPAFYPSAGKKLLWTAFVDMQAKMLPLLALLHTIAVLLTCDKRLDSCSADPII